MYKLKKAFVKMSNKYKIKLFKMLKDERFRTKVLERDKEFFKFVVSFFTEDVVVLPFPSDDTKGTLRGLGPGAVVDLGINGRKHFF
jgi:hypothetical protein